MEKQKLINVLYFCAGQCTHCYDACHLDKENNMEHCMVNSQDCSDICRLTGQLLERNSPNVDIFLKLSAQMCERCASECDKYTSMSHCEKCAEACRKCVEMCHENMMIH